MKLYTNGVMTYALKDKNQIDAFLSSGFREVEAKEMPESDDKKVAEAPKKRGRKAQSK